MNDGRLILRRPSIVTMNLPMEWLERASGLPGRTLQVALVLLYLMNLHRSSEVRFNQRILKRFRTSRDASYDALNRLAEHRLVRLEKSPGRAHVVVLLAFDGQPLKIA